MRMFRVALAALIGFHANVYGNTEMLEDEDCVVTYKLAQLMWRNELTSDQEAEVLRALKSDKDTVVKSALTVVALQGMQKNEGFVCTVEQGLNVKVGYAPSLALLIVEAANTGRTIEEQFEFKRAQMDSHLQDVLRGWLTEYRVIEEARARRGGAKADPSISSQNLPVYYKLLLEYSSLPESEARSTLVALLAEAANLSTTNHELARVLASYGDRAFPEVAARLRWKEESDEPSSFGKIILVRYIEQVYCLMDSPKRIETQRLLREISSDDDPKLASQVRYALERLAKYDQILDTRSDGS